MRTDMFTFVNMCCTRMYTASMSDMADISVRYYEHMRYDNMMRVPNTAHELLHLTYALDVLLSAPPAKSSRP